MESIRLIIQKLALQQQTGASIAQLQHTTEQLRQALVLAAAADSPLAGAASVAVIMPGHSGWAPVPPVAIATATAIEEPQPPVEVTPVAIAEPQPPVAATLTTTATSQPAIAPLQEVLKAHAQEDIPTKVLPMAPEIVQPAPAPAAFVEAPIYTAPRPPLVTAIAQPDAPAAEKVVAVPSPTVSREQQLSFWDTPATSAPEPADEIITVPNTIPAAVPEVQTIVPQAADAPPAEEEDGPVYFELDIPEDWHPLPQEAAKPSTLIPEGFLNMSHAKAPLHDVETTVAPREKPKELHEILAARVVASPERPLAEKPTYVADKIGGSKIADLKKGIAINDRFRFINSLFRGDEAQFERAVKTINNFSILQEAMYWIQRELVVKNGWNEEDELVQSFFHLVRRRFL